MNELMTMMLLLIERFFYASKCQIFNVKQG